MSAELWFSECLQKQADIKTPSPSNFIYKGYKLSRSGESYTIQNVRLNDFYTTVSDKELLVLNKYGFIEGADLLSYKRNKRRVNNYTKTLERLYHIREEYENKGDQVYYIRKLVNCEERILYYLDLLLLYKSKVVRYEEVKNIIND